MTRSKSTVPLRQRAPYTRVHPEVKFTSVPCCSTKCGKNLLHTRHPSWGGVQGLPPVSGEPEEVQVAHTLSLLWGNPPTDKQEDGVWSNSFLVGTGTQGQAPLSLPLSPQGPLRISPLRISHPSTCPPGHTKIQDDKCRKPSNPSWIYY